MRLYRAFPWRGWLKLDVKKNNTYFQTVGLLIELTHGASITWPIVCGRYTEVHPLYDPLEYYLAVDYLNKNE